MRGILSQPLTDEAHAISLEPRLVDWQMTLMMSIFLAGFHVDLYIPVTYNLLIHACHAAILTNQSRASDLLPLFNEHVPD